MFAYEFKDPESYGVVEFDMNNKTLSLEEKSRQPKSNCAFTGLHFCDNQMVESGKNIQFQKEGNLKPPT